MDHLYKPSIKFILIADFNLDYLKLSSKYQNLSNTLIQKTLFFDQRG